MKLRFLFIRCMSYSAHCQDFPSTLLENPRKQEQPSVQIIPVVRKSGFSSYDTRPALLLQSFFSWKYILDVLHNSAQLNQQIFLECRKNIEVHKYERQRNLYVWLLCVIFLCVQTQQAVKLFSFTFRRSILWFTTLLHSLGNILPVFSQPFVKLKNLSL